MKRKLSITRETLRALATHQLTAARGGVDNSADWFPCVTERLTNCVERCQSSPERCGEGSGAC